MTTRSCLTLLIAAWVACMFSLPAAGYDLVLNDYGEDAVLATAVDQPRQSFVITDNGQVIEDGGVAVVMNAFIDTGASGTVISYLNAEGYSYNDLFSGFTVIPSLGFDGEPAGEFIGQYTEIGVGGTEVGNVTREFGLKLINGQPKVVTGDTYSQYADQFVDYGQHNLWVRQSPGVGEATPLPGFEEFDIELVDPINIVGMPVIQQRVMVMDPTPIATGSVMATHLLPAGDAAIPTDYDVTFDVIMHPFVGDPPAGEVLPTHASNPMIPGVSLSHDGASIGDQSWLFDTGAGSSFVGLQQAWDLGLIPDGMSLADFNAQHAASGGIVMPIGGIGDPINVPLVTIDEIRLPAANSKLEVIWENVDILILDVAGLDGVFGMNLLLPSSTIDPDDPMAGLGITSPGYFDWVIFDAANSEIRAKLGLELPELLGDFDGDFDVDGADFLAWQVGYPTASGATREMGDSDGDGDVDGADFLDWQVGYPYPPAASPIPEPATITLLACGVIALWTRRR